MVGYLVRGVVVDAVTRVRAVVEIRFSARAEICLGNGREKESGCACEDSLANSCV